MKRSALVRAGVLFALMAACALCAWHGHAAATHKSGLVAMLLFAIGSLCASAAISRALDWAGFSPDPSRAPNPTRAAVRRIAICLAVGAGLLTYVFLTRGDDGRLRLVTYALGLLVGGCFFTIMKAIADTMLATR